MNYTFIIFLYFYTFKKISQGKNGSVKVLQFIHQILIKSELLQTQIWHKFCRSQTAIIFLFTKTDSSGLREIFCYKSVDTVTVNIVKFCLRRSSRNSCGYPSLCIPALWGRTFPQGGRIVGTGDMGEMKYLLQGLIQLERLNPQQETGALGKLYYRKITRKLLGKGIFVYSVTGRSR